MKRAANLGMRQAWLWRHHGSFGEQRNSSVPRLLVDVSAIMRHDAQTGIQRVVRAVWSELRRRSGADVEVLPVFATSTHGFCYAPIDFLECRVSALVPVPVRMASGDKFLGLDLSAHLLPKYRGQLRSWRAHGATVHLIVYDLLPLLRPAWFTRSAVAHFRKWLELLMREADQAICISDHVSGDLRRVFREANMQRQPQIVRLRMGADISATVPSKGISEELKRALEEIRFRPTILMVGTVEPRKGYTQALAAFDHLWRMSPKDSPDLVIVGKAGWKTAKLQGRIRSHPAFGRRLKWFEDVSDEGLALLYEACRGLLMASRGEGWGLPLVEAAMHRRHVLARDVPVFREHGLQNVRYFSDDGPQFLGDALRDLAKRGREPAQMISLPTWSGCVDRLLLTIGITEIQPGAFATTLRKVS